MAPPARRDIGAGGAPQQDGSVAEFRISPEELRRLARLVEENGLSELRYEEGDLRITLRSASFEPARSAVASALEALHDNGTADRPPPAVPVPEPRVPSFSAPTVRIEAPVMGVFYRAPAPGAPPFVEVGEMVEAGQPVGMIEAMKVFSEVLVEAAGVIRDIPAKNGALVQPGDTLLVVEVLES